MAKRIVKTYSVKQKEEELHKQFEKIITQGEATRSEVIMAFIKRYVASKSKPTK